MQLFDRCDVVARCRELLQRLSVLSSSCSPPWKWDILEFLEESKMALLETRRANLQDSGHWPEIREVLLVEQDASTLPVALKTSCQELLARRETWLGQFDTEHEAILKSGRNLRERLLFEDLDRAGWFGSTAGVNPSEVQQLLERHLELHQQSARLVRQLQSVARGLRQQGATSARRRAFQERTVGDKLQSSLVSLATVAMAPMPGAAELWLASTSLMWLSADQAWQHAVYEHPRGAEATESILNQFQCNSSRARQCLADWNNTPASDRRGCVMIHNASVRCVKIKTHFVNVIDGAGDKRGDWTSALEAHPIGPTIHKAVMYVWFGDQASDEQTEVTEVVIAPQRLVVVQLPPKPDTNWSWRGVFSYGDTRVGECTLKEGGVFSFICVDCGLRVGDRGDEADFSPWYAQEPGSPESEASRQMPTVVSRAALTSFLHSRQEDEEAEGEEWEEPSAMTTVEVLNRMDDAVNVKIFTYSSDVSQAIFRKPLCEGAVSAGLKRLFSLSLPPEEKEAVFDVEIRMGRKYVKCEVVGEQVIVVDGMVA